jgi:hypothetical protein
MVYTVRNGYFLRVAVRLSQVYQYTAVRHMTRL